MKKFFVFLIVAIAITPTIGAQLTVNLSSSVDAVTASLSAEFADLKADSTVSAIFFNYRVQGPGGYTAQIGSPFSLVGPGPKNSYATLTSLQQDTDYEFYVSYNYKGTAYSTATSSFHTGTYTSATVTTNEASNISGTAATLNGSITVGSEGTLYNVKFEYGTDLSYGSSTTSSNYSADTDVSASISGLTAGTIYHFRIVATDWSSGFPTPITGDDKQFTATAAPVISSFDSHSTSQFDVNWTFSGTATTYYLDVASDSDFNNLVAGFNNKNVGNVLTTTVNGLSAGTTYYCRLRADLSGGGTTGNSATDNTITICDAPTATAASAIGVAQFTANWSTQTGASSYLLDVSLADDFTTFVGSYKDHEVGGASISEVVSGLSPSTDYYYRLRAKNSSGNSDYSNTTGPVTTLDVDEVEWDGSESTDWTTAANWEYNTVPTASIGAVIPAAPSNQPVIDSVSVSCKFLTIKPGASLTYTGNRKRLTISDGDLTIESNSSNTGEIAITGGNSITISNGNAIFEQYIPGNKWVYISVPMPGVMSDDFFLNHSPEVYLKYFVEGKGYAGGNIYVDAMWQYIEPRDTSVNLARGYAMWIAGAAQTFSIEKSNFNNGNTSFTLKNSNVGSSGYGWNLVGNPYPSHIDFNKLNDDNAAQIETGYYTWHNGSYIGYNDGLGYGGADQYVPPFQGIIVKAKSNNATLSFANDQRAAASSTLFKELKKVNDYVRLIAKNKANSKTDELLVRFKEGATDGFDGFTESYKMYGNYGIPQIFTYLEDGTELSINAFAPERKNNVIVPIGIFVSEHSDLEFSLSEMESFQHQIPIKVRDLETGDVFDLTENPVFEVELDSGYYLNRFEMLFGENTSIPDQLTLKNDLIRINSDNQYINIAVLGEDVQLPLTVEVFDITGKLINKTLVNKTGTSRIYMQHNVKTCVTRLSGNNINKVQKLIIN